MRTGDEEPLSIANLLWEPTDVSHYLVRDERYRRLRERAESGISTLSAQAYADVVAKLHLRAAGPIESILDLQELREFRVAVLDRKVAEAFGEAYRLCLASARNQGRNEPEGWFVWNVALHRRHGCRVLTNDRSRYAGLVEPESLV